VVHTADLGAARRTQIRALLDRAFAGRFDDADWDHALGGLHVLIAERSRIVAHASVVQRRLVHAGRALRTGYVEAVAVDEDRRGRGHAATVMDQVERVIRAAYDLGALSTSRGVSGFYLARGWVVWQGPTAVLGPSGIVATPDDDGSTFVLPVPSTPLHLAGMLACDWRDGDVW
jgi:aminoglycoside 2'-N-acetyltransferase I